MMISIISASLSAVALAVIMLLPSGRRAVFGHPRTNQASAAWLSVLIIAAVVWALIFSFLSGAKHDYIEYEKMWQIVLDGLPPWGPHSTNTYGPMFNALALPYQIDHRLPKVLFNLAWLSTSLWLLGICVRRGCDDWVTWGTFVLLLCCPYLWAQFPRHGLNDAIPASLTVLAVAGVDRRRPWLAGFAVAVGALLKVYPLLVLPFLVLPGRRVRWRVAAGTALGIAAGAAVSVAIWGDAAATALKVNSGRPSTYLSIFHTLRTSLADIPGLFGLASFDSFSLPAMIVCGGSIALYGWWLRLPSSATSAAGVTAMILCYKVGHAQFLVVTAFLIVYWLAVRRSTCENMPQSLKLSLLAFWSWMCLVETAYPLTGGFTRPYWDRVHFWLGVPTFFLGSWMTLAVLKTARDDSRRSIAEPACEPPVDQG